MEPRPPEASDPASPEARLTQLGPIRFGVTGISVKPRRRARPWGKTIPYAEITHCSRARWGYAIATTRGIIFVRQSQFASREALASADVELRARIAGLPEGAAQLEQMAQIDARSSRPGRYLAVYGFLALCVVAQFLQFDDPAISHMGSFMPSLVAQGELWRVLVANFLHDTLLFPVHLLLNAICIFSFGVLVERTLGPSRSVFIMGVSGAGAMWASSLAGYSEVIGGSGVAAGLVGATLCLEFNAARFLPVWSRIPRRVFLGALLAQGVVDLAIPFVAGAAHAGGFLSGYIATRFFVGRGRGITASGPLSRRLALLVILLLAISVAAMQPLVERDPVALEAHGIRVLEMPDPSVRYDNEAAWRMLTESKPSETGVEVAVVLALRAAQRSHWSDPNVLDTLAESLFASGDRAGALEVIYEAIILSRGHRYFMEQRDRFLGRRDPEDRPEPPEEGWWRQPDPSPGEDPLEPGIEPAAPGESVWI